MCVIHLLDVSLTNGVHVVERKAMRARFRVLQGTSSGFEGWRRLGAEMPKLGLWAKIRLTWASLLSRTRSRWYYRSKSRILHLRA